MSMNKYKISFEKEENVIFQCVGVFCTQAYVTARFREIYVREATLPEIFGFN